MRAVGFALFRRQEYARGRAEKMLREAMDGMEVGGNFKWHKSRGKNNPFIAPVPFWGQTTQIPSYLSPFVPKTRLQS